MTLKNTNGGRAPLQSLAVGQSFNPYGLFNSIWIPLGILRHPTLSDGAKLLYGRLCLFAGKSGECHAGRDTMAAELGTSLKTVGRQLEELVNASLIRRVRRGPNRPAGCIFLWHPCLKSSIRGGPDGSKVTYQESADGSDVTYQEPSLMGHFCPLDGSELTRPDGSLLTHSYKEEKIQYEKIQRKDSSSFEENASVAGSASPEPERIDDDEPSLEILEGELLEPVESVKAGATWASHPEAFESVREALRMHKYSESQGERPDSTITRKLMAHFTGEDDFLGWLENLAGRMPGYKVKSYAFYVRDAEDWPSRRADFLEAKIRQEREAQANAAEAEKRKREVTEYERIRELCRGKGWKSVFASSCTNCAGYGKNPVSEEFCHCAAGEELQRCRQCNNQGAIPVWPSGAESKTKPVLDKWCTCQHAERVKAEKGADFVDRQNAQTWADFRYQKQSDRWDELYRANKRILRAIPGFKEIERGFVGGVDEGDREIFLSQFVEGIARCSASAGAFRSAAA